MSAGRAVPLSDPYLSPAQELGAGVRALPGGDSLNLYQSHRSKHRAPRVRADLAPCWKSSFLPVNCFITAHCHDLKSFFVFAKGPDKPDMGGGKTVL